MRNRIYTWFRASLVLLCFTTAVCADIPLVSGQVVTDNGVTRYIYTVTNILSSGQIAALYNMILPDGTLAIGHSEPAGWAFWYRKAGNRPWGEFQWLATNDQSMLQPGQSAVLEVYTSHPVVTQWISNWMVGVYPVGGRSDAFNDGTALPVPVPIPEPSSLLALAGGMAGLGGVILRRKHN